MQYDLFLFDLDDTLLDFGGSEKLSFFNTLKSLGQTDKLEQIFEHYQFENRALWKLLEQGKIDKEHLRVERFRKVFDTHKIKADPEVASHMYLEMLPETVALTDGAEEVCKWLSQHGEIGVITNGFHSVQGRRVENSAIAPYISFVSASDVCGVGKPDVKFFEFTIQQAKKFAKETTVLIGDRLETDIQGAKNFGIDACWFNPGRQVLPLEYDPKYIVNHLTEIPGLFRS